MDTGWLALPGAMLWSVIIALPWQPWRIGETLKAMAGSMPDLSDITALIPARNEADCIATTLTALSQQGHGLNMVLINDESTDTTVATAEALHLENLTIINSPKLPRGWTGKLWALQHGLNLAETDKLLLLDADIELLPGTIAALKRKMQIEERQLISLMAVLPMRSGWERLLLPAFIYFFKLLYPFQLANSRHPLIAAAAGGCILLDRKVLIEIGGFAAIKDAIIDDCRLARKIKAAGYRTWTGLTQAAISRRPYERLTAIWSMVTRTAFTQLRCSVGLLVLCTLLMISTFVLPVLSLALFAPGPGNLALGNLTLGSLTLLPLLIMVLSYLPTVCYYQLHPVWALALPLSACLYLLMTWHSAWRYWCGAGPSWKDRHY